MSCRKVGPDRSGILSLSNSCLRPPGRRKERLLSELARLAVHPIPTLSTDGCNPLPALCSSKDRDFLPLPQRQGHSFTEDTDAPVGGVPPAATQGYRIPEHDPATATSTTLCHSPDFKGVTGKLAEIPVAPPNNCLVVSLLEGKSSMHMNSCCVSHTSGLYTLTSGPPVSLNTCASLLPTSCLLSSEPSSVKAKIQTVVKKALHTRPLITSQTSSPATLPFGLPVPSTMSAFPRISTWLAPTLPSSKRSSPLRGLHCPPYLTLQYPSQIYYDSPYPPSLVLHSTCHLLLNSLISLFVSTSSM